MNTKKPIGITLLAIFLAWGMYNTVARIFLRSDSADIMILSHYGISLIGYGLAILLLMLNVVALYCTLMKKRFGANVLYTFFALNVLFTIFVTVLSLLDLEMSKNVYIQSRTSRGLNVENVDAIVNPAVTLVMTAAYVIFYSLLANFVRKNKEYFSS